MTTSVKQTIHEHDVVAFVQAVDKDEGVGEWPTGTIGAIVLDCGDVKMVEIANGRGEALDFVMVPVEQLTLIAKHSE